MPCTASWDALIHISFRNTIKPNAIIAHQNTAKHTSRISTSYEKLNAFVDPSTNTNPTNTIVKVMKTDEKRIPVDSPPTEGTALAMTAIVTIPTAKNTS
eukprot:CAMPEP_0184519926 /NCGR_PEP_ID=MMETSP0198_2-20121128/6890_1 /TAXON_ID=1112570 /ORGANISM="Thraustochytrium sp., Strain LLF1b" /LENGTH=98 /DNA_ID=CAMNT_0026910481 /DNA_START=918 /DNA_END=1214 /DNA_ORIENTATION=-